MNMYWVLQNALRLMFRCAFQFIGPAVFRSVLAVCSSGSVKTNIVRVIKQFNLSTANHTPLKAKVL